MPRLTRRGVATAPAMAALAALLAAGAPPARAADDDGLRRAYELERRTLEQERRSLEEEIERARAAHDDECARLSSSIDARRVALAAARREADAADARLADLEAARAGSATDDETLAVTVDQALLTLRRLGSEVEPPEGASDAERLGIVLAEAAAVLRERGSVRAEPGAFFLPDGREVTGTVLRVGEVAALGLAGDRGGALVPAGGETLRVADEDAGAVRALLGGRGLVMTDVRLFDPVTRGDADDGRPDPWERVRSGGPLVWPILALGLLAALVVAERLWTLHRLRPRTAGLQDEVLRHVRGGRWGDALRCCHRAGGAAGRVLAAGLRHRDLAGHGLDDVLSESIARETPALQRLLPLLAVIAAVSPLLGLLGTVTGMISTFDVITEHGTGDPQMLSGGISVALVTTQLGLTVAIPVLLVQNLLAAAAERLEGDLLRGAMALDIALQGVRDPTPRAAAEVPEPAPLPGGTPVRDASAVASAPAARVDAGGPP